MIVYFKRFIKCHSPAAQFSKHQSNDCLEPIEITQLPISIRSCAEFEPSVSPGLRNSLTTLTTTVCFGSESDSRVHSNLTSKSPPNFIRLSPADHHRQTTTGRPPSADHHRQTTTDRSVLILPCAAPIRAIHNDLDTVAVLLELPHGHLPVLLELVPGVRQIRLPK